MEDHMPKGLSPAARVMAFFANVSLPEAEQMFELVKETMKVRRTSTIIQTHGSKPRSHKKPSGVPPTSEATPLGTKRTRRTHAQMVQDALVQSSNLPGVQA
jgi:hypothetical protein